MITRYKRSVLLKEMMMPFLMAMTVILLIVFAIIPGIQYVQELFTSLQSVNAENTLLQKKVTALSQFDEQTLSERMALLLSAVPADKSIASILSTVEQVANDNGVAISQLSISNPGSLSSDSASIKVNTKLGSNTIQIKTDIVGSMDSILAFTTKIRSVRRLLRISTLNQTFTSDAASSGSAKASFSLEAFYAPLPRSLGATETQITPFSENEEMMISKISNYPLNYQTAPMTAPGQIESGNKIDPFSF